LYAVDFLWLDLGVATPENTKGLFGVLGTMGGIRNGLQIRIYNLNWSTYIHGNTHHKKLYIGR